jgi:hypothetical protein
MESCFVFLIITRNNKYNVIISNTVHSHMLVPQLIEVVYRLVRTINISFVSYLTALYAQFSMLQMIIYIILI